MQVVPYFVYLTVLGVLYIALNHYSDRLVSRINKQQKQVEALRVDYTTLQYEFMYLSKQSAIKKQVAPLGLTEGDTPPIHISGDTHR